MFKNSCGMQPFSCENFRFFLMFTDTFDFDQNGENVFIFWTKGIHTV